MNKTVTIKLCFTPILLLIAFTQIVSAQTVSGKVTANHSPVEYATVAVYALADSNKIINAVNTDSLGNFFFRNLSFNSYYLKIHSLGFVSLTKSFVIDNEHQNIFLNEIELQPDTKTLNEVTITSQKQLLKKTQNGFIVSAKDNISQASGTATDLLRNVPTVVVDEDGNISIRGKSPLILINGRNSNLSATDRIPASSVESIEIINNPTAKYDADAEGGICLLYTSPSPRDLSTSRMPSSA